MVWYVVCDGMVCGVGWCDVWWYGMWCVMVWCGVGWCGMWCVMVWYVVWDGVVCDGVVCGVWWCGVVCDGMVCGVWWYGMWCVMVWCGVVCDGVLWLTQVQNISSCVKVAEVFWVQLYSFVCSLHWLFCVWFYSGLKRDTEQMWGFNSVYHDYMLTNN